MSIVFGLIQTPPNKTDTAWNGDFGSQGSAKKEGADAAIRALATSSLRTLPWVLERLTDDSCPLGRTMGSPGTLARFESDNPADPQAPDNRYGPVQPR